MLMLVFFFVFVVFFFKLRGGGRVMNSEIIYTYFLQNRYSYDGVFEEENKTIKKVHHVNSL